LQRSPVQVRAPRQVPDLIWTLQVPRSTSFNPSAEVWAQRVFFCFIYQRQKTPRRAQILLSDGRQIAHRGTDVGVTEVGLDDNGGNAVARQRHRHIVPERVGTQGTFETTHFTQAPRDLRDGLSGQRPMTIYIPPTGMLPWRHEGHDLTRKYPPMALFPAPPALDPGDLSGLRRVGRAR
jgi:hypothetical protein